MNLTPSEAAVAAWKRQIDLTVQLAQVIIQSAQQVHDIQRDAAVEAHAWLEAARNAVATTTPAELGALQTRFANENLGKMAQYWSALAANGRNTQARILELMTRSFACTPLLAEGTQGAPSAQALNELVDAGYQQWLKTMRSLYAAPAAAAPA